MVLGRNFLLFRLAYGAPVCEFQQGCSSVVAATSAVTALKTTKVKNNEEDLSEDVAASKFGLD